jgi:hypothetical protein
MLELGALLANRFSIPHYSCTRETLLDEIQNKHKIGGIIVLQRGGVTAGTFSQI